MTLHSCFLSWQQMQGLEEQSSGVDKTIEHHWYHLPDCQSMHILDHGGYLHRRTDSPTILFA